MGELNNMYKLITKAEQDLLFDKTEDSSKLWILCSSCKDTLMYIEHESYDLCDDCNKALEKGKILTKYTLLE